MKKIIVGVILFCMIGVCSGCGDAYDNIACYYSVKKAYPNANVYTLPKARYRFLVVDGNSITYVITNSMSSTEITSKYILQKGE